METASTETLRHVTEAIESRRSVRAFLDEDVPKEVLEDMLRVAARAPSGNNTQPWKVYALKGDAKTQLSEAVMQAHEESIAHPAKLDDWDYPYYPERFVEPYLSRRRANGWSLYQLLGIERGDKEKMHAQMGRNYLFFDAPVGLIFTTHKSMAMGAWIDMGAYMQNVMTMARAYDLHTCPQAAFVAFHRVVRETLSISEDEIVICGMSLGYEDTSALVNQLRTEREPLENFADFRGEW